MRIARFDHARIQYGHTAPRKDNAPCHSQLISAGADVVAMDDHGQRSTGQTSSGRTILTLYGGERSAKQLFSSLGKRKTPDDFNEQALPVGITTTKIIPAHTIDENQGKKATFRNQYPPPANLPPLSTPRPSTHTTTRNSVVQWHKPSLIPAKKSPDRRQLFSSHQLPTGSWLNYNAPPRPTPDSPETKRKQRDRRLSYGEAPPSPTRAETTASFNQAKDDALFQSVYSSFAPEKDDSLAIIAADQKNRLWWSQRGINMYEDLLKIKNEDLYGSEDLEDEDSAIEDGANADVLLNTNDPVDSTTTLLNGDREDIDIKVADGVPDAKQTELLGEISELIETLHSYQHSRYESLSISARPTSGHNPGISGNNSGPSEPSATEVKFYETLQKKLVTLVSDLPPYLLTKVGGDQLGEFLVDPRIRVSPKNQRGTLEEEELAARARAATRPPVPAANSPIPSGFPNAVPRNTYTPQSQQPSQQHSRTPYTASTGTRPAVPNNYTAGHYGARPAQPQYPSGMNRSTFSSNIAYVPHRPPMYTDRFANGVYATPQSYNPQVNGYRPPGPQASTYPQQYASPQPRMHASPPGSAAPMQGYRAPPLDYQQRAAGMHGTYTYGHTPVAAGGSPQPQNRPPFPPPGQITYQHQQRPPVYAQGTPMTPSRTTTEPQTNGASANAGVSVSPGDPAAVATMMNRQKGQISEEQAQQARQASSTPQAVVENGVQHNGVGSSQ